MTELKKDLALIEVTEQVGKNITLSFLDVDGAGSVYDVVWNLRKYNPDAKGQDKWEQSDEQEAQVEKWSQDVFGVPMVELKNLASGSLDNAVRKDVYHYGSFNSLWEVSRIEKFSKDRVGEILTVTVKEISEDAKGFHVQFEEDGKTHAVTFTTAKFVEMLGKFVNDPVKEEKAKTKFKDTFGITYDEREKLVGEEIMIEVKLAFGQFPYAEAKKLTEARKKQLQEK